MPQELANEMATKTGIYTLIEKNPNKVAKAFLKWTEFASIKAATNRVILYESNNDKSGGTKIKTEIVIITHLTDWRSQTTATMIKIRVDKTPDASL